MTTSTSDLLAIVRPAGGRHVARPAQRTRAGESQRFRPDIEGMRAIAILLVVAYHAGLGLVPGGYVGVDVFFVLSGFLITGLLVDELQRSGHISLTRFYGRRARRLLPLSALVIAATVLATYLLVPPLDHGSVGADLRAAALYFANWHFASDATQYMADTAHSPALHFWSLSVEEQFYVVWPLLILLVAGRGAVARHDWRVVLRRLVVALGALLGVSLAVSVVLTPRSSSWSYFGLHTRAWELAAGAAVALGRTHLRRLPRLVAVLAGWLGLGLIVWSALRYGATTPFPGTAALLPVGGAVLVVAAGIRVQAAGAARLLSTRRLTYVGRISYAWYLWHWPVLVFTQLELGGSTDPNQPGPVQHAAWWAVALAVAVSFGLAAASNVLVETPVRSSRWLSAARNRSLVLGIALTLTSVLVTNLVLGGGSAAADTVKLANGSQVRLTLSAEDARSDIPKIPAAGCYASPSASDAPAGCLGGDPHGTKTVALLGDSHAEQWYPAIDAVAKARHWKLYLWTKSFCPMVDAKIWVGDGSTGGRYRSCESWRGSVLSHLRDLGTVDLVLLGHSSGYQTRVITDGGRLTGPDDVTGPWQQATRRTLADLAPLAGTVALLNETPWPGQDVPACVSEHSPAVAPCTFRRSDGVGSDAPLLAGERALARGGALRFVDLTKPLCPSAVCPVVDAAGTIMYRDDQHLTATEALSLQAPVDAVLSPLLAS